MIKVLFLAANPAGTNPLALDEEIRAIDGKIRGSTHRDLIEMVSHWAIRLDDLSGILMRHRPNVVHFSGHGSTAGDICLIDSDGGAKPTTPKALAGLFRVLQDNVRVVVFNACHSEAHAKAVAREVDCAVGMSRAINDEHAIAFAAEFYQALGFGKSVADAYELGVVRLIGEGVGDSRKLAKLHKRRDVDPRSVVLIAASLEAPTSPHLASDADRRPNPQPTALSVLAETVPRAPRVFISYSWEDEAHAEWVLRFAIRLRKDGVDVTLDRWHAVSGDQIPAFMEQSVRENDFVITVCTPRFKERSDGRSGGVGYEGDITTAEVFTSGNQRKFIPVLRSGNWREAAPSWLLGKVYIDLSGDPYSEKAYAQLLRVLHGELESAPPIGLRPTFRCQPDYP